MSQKFRFKNKRFRKRIQLEMLILSLKFRRWQFSMKSLTIMKIISIKYQIIVFSSSILECLWNTILSIIQMHALMCRNHCLLFTSTTSWLKFSMSFVVENFCKPYNFFFRMNSLFHSSPDHMHLFCGYSVQKKYNAVFPHKPSPSSCIVIRKMYVYVRYMLIITL